MRKKLFIFMFIIFFSIPYNLLWAYDGEVHKKINEEATFASNLDSILKNHLGMNSGIYTKLKKIILDGKPVELVWEWLSYGGEVEDYGKKGTKDDLSTRSYNHFHDPLKDWGDAGLWGMGSGQGKYLI